VATKSTSERKINDLVANKSVNLNYKRRYGGHHFFSLGDLVATRLFDAGLQGSIIYLFLGLGSKHVRVPNPIILFVRRLFSFKRRDPYLMEK
jgi:hypothetical protein